MCRSITTASGASVGELIATSFVGRLADHRQLGLVVDQRLERFEEARVVVREQNATGAQPPRHGCLIRDDVSLVA